jgi:hypothetical protein
VARKYHNVPVIRTWKNQAISDVLPKSLIIVGFNSIPTINNSKAIPKFPNDSNAVFACNNHGTKRLIAIPAIIYQIIIGCFNAFMIPTLSSTIPITIPSEVKNCSVIKIMNI